MFWGFGGGTNYIGIADSATISDTKLYDITISESENGTVSATFKAVLLVPEGESQVTPQIPAYSVSFDSNGGSEVASQTVMSGGSAEIPSVPMKNGSEFMGWYSDSGFPAKYDFSSVVTENITVYTRRKVVRRRIYLCCFFSGRLLTICPLR